MILDILEKSGEKFDRQKYVSKLKEHIAHSQELVERELEYIKKLKIKISEYDIYNQTKPYESIPTENASSIATKSDERGSGLGETERVEEAPGNLGDVHNQKELDLSDIPEFK